MGGHGGLNILPQKRWNVYNYDNREKVRQDEEAAAKEEQLKHEQARKREAEFRLERLRASRGLAPLKRAPEPKEEAAQNRAPEPKEEAAEEPVESEPKSGHINLFEGIKIFDPIRGLENETRGEKDGFKKKKMKKEEVAPKIITPEEEKYRLGYGIAGKGVKLPWYLERRRDDVESGNDGLMRGVREEGKKKSGKKTLKELRDERLKRERLEKERERAVISEKERAKSQRDGGFSRRVV